MAEKSLKDKTVSGVGWSAASAVLSYGVTFVVGLVLARLLSPEEYGLIGIVTIFTSVLLGVVDSGFSNALIRKVNVTDDDFSTLFYFNIVISILMYVILYVTAPWISRFFERPQLINLVRVTGLLLFISAFSIVQNTILTKRVDFRSKTKVSVSASVISGFVGIIMAFWGFGVWSLVAQQLSYHMVYSLGLWSVNSWRPSARFSLQSLSYMWNFGWKILASGLINNLWVELKKVVVSKYYSPATLGQFSRAEEYARIFSNNMTSIIQRVSYPVLAEVQENKERMVSVYRRVIKMSVFITAICMLFLGSVADPLIYCLIGPKWHMAATFLPFICIYASLYPLQAINLNMLQVQGRTDIFLYLEIIKKIIYLVPLFLGAFVDIYWMLIASIGMGIVSFFLNSYYTGKRVGYSSLMQLADVAPSYGIAFVVALTVYFFKYLPISNFVILPIQLVVGLAVFFLLCEITKMQEYVEIKELTVEYIRKVRQS